MLTSLIIGSDASLSGKLAEALTSTRRVTVLQRVGHYPIVRDVAALLEQTGPDFLFVDFTARTDAEALAAAVAQLAPRTLLVAFGNREDPEILLQVMRAGIREYLASPFRSGVLHDRIGRLEGSVIHTQATAKIAPVVAFLPARMGCGATTVAVNTNASLARRGDARSLLIDFDLNAGLIGFLLRVDNPHAIVEAAQNVDELDDELWRQMICTSGSLDILPTGAYRYDFRVQAEQVRKILLFARRRYQCVSVDLSGMIEQFSLEVLLMASRIYLVCTAEMSSLHLASRKLAYLRGLDLEDRMHVLLNRHSVDNEAEHDLVENTLGVPVHAHFPNDYRAVHRSFVEGKPVDASSRLGKAYANLADSLLPRLKAEAEPKRRFLPFRKTQPA
jgi:pilus assembly protein CpaE